MNLKSLLEKQILLESKLNFITQKINGNGSFEYFEKLNNREELYKDFELFYKLVELRNYIKKQIEQKLIDEKFGTADLNIIEEKINIIFNKYVKIMSFALKSFLGVHIKGFNKYLFLYCRPRFNYDIRNNDMESFKDSYFDLIQLKKFIVYDSIPLKMKNIDILKEDIFTGLIRYIYHGLKNIGFANYSLRAIQNNAFFILEYLLHNTQNSSSLNYAKGKIRSLFIKLFNKFYKADYKTYGEYINFLHSNNSNIQINLAKTTYIYFEKIYLKIKEIMDFSKNQLISKFDEKSLLDDIYNSFHYDIINFLLKNEIDKIVEFIFRGLETDEENLKDREFIKNVFLECQKKIFDLPFTPANLLYLYKNDIVHKEFIHKDYGMLEFTRINFSIYNIELVEWKDEFIKIFENTPDILFRDFETNTTLLVIKTYNLLIDTYRTNDLRKKIELFDSLIHLEHHDGSIFEYVFYATGNPTFLLDKGKIDKLHAKNFEKEINEIYRIYYNKAKGL